MRIAARLFVSCVLILPLWSFGQPANRSAAADHDWDGLTTLRNNAAITKSTNKSGVSSTAAKKAKSDGFRQLAQSAKDFYTKHPDDSNASAAKKLEALASIEGIRDDDKPHELTALKTASDFRKNKNNSPPDRFEVAEAMDRQQLSQKLAGKHPATSPKDFEKLADNLRKEFGGTPEVFGLYAHIAHSVDHEAGNRVATKMLELDAPPSARSQAHEITVRHGLLGRTFDVQFTALNGQKIDSTKLADKPTVIYLSSAGRDGKSSGFFTGLLDLKKPDAKDIQWIYVYLSATPAQVTAAKSKAPFEGIYCLEPAGMGSPIVQRLKVSSLPCVFVLDRKGRLSGFGRVSELPILIAEAHVKGGRP